MSKTRHLTVMFTDVKGFTSKTSFSSREKLDSFLQLHDKLLAPIFKSHNGKIVKTIGDAFLVIFTSPTNAVLCGIAIQEKLKEYNKDVPKDEKLEVRVSINSGEVTIKDNDIFGETVNIAARLEGITKAGEIYFTESVYLSMNKNEIAAKEVGFKRFKGIPEKIKIFKVISSTRKKFIFFGKEKPIKRKLKKKSKLKKVLKIIVPIFVLFLLVSVISNSSRHAREENVMQNVERLKGEIDNALLEMDETRIQDGINELYQYESEVENNTYITETISYYETKYSELQQNKDNTYNQVNLVTQKIENALSRNDGTVAQKNLELLDELSQKLNRPNDVENTLHYYQEKYNSYVQEIDNLWDQVNNARRDIEISFAYKDTSGVLQNIGVLKHLSGQLGNPSDLEKDIQNYESRYDSLVQEQEQQKNINLVATTINS